MKISALVCLVACAAPQREGDRNAGDRAPNLFAVPKLAPVRGPLRVHPRNPRYFADGAGKAILLTGAHTWANLVDMGPTDPPEPFDFDAYLDFLVTHRHNFIRLWTWSYPIFQYNKGDLTYATPMPWSRSGPEMALDGKPRFDLTKLDPVYFNRLRERVSQAGKRGIYVAVMVFEGHALHGSKTPWIWDGHPFNPANNINGIDGDPARTGRGFDTQTLKVPAVVDAQKKYLRHVVDTLNDLDNVLYEIANEAGIYSKEWQYHMIEFIKDYQRGKPKQHPVGMSMLHTIPGHGPNSDLFESPADWISPGRSTDGYDVNPPAGDGRKVILSDTDHIFGIGGTVGWVWKTMCRGLNPVYMDTYLDRARQSDPPWPESSFTDHLVTGTHLDPRWEGIRRNMGYGLAFAQRMDMDKAVPNAKLASTNYCLSTGREFLVYLPEGGETSVDLTGAKGRFGVEWLAPDSGITHEGGDVTGGAPLKFVTPFAGHAVLFLHAK